MQSLKKISLLLAFVLITATLPGCSLIASRLRQLNEETAIARKSNLEISNSILDCFSQNDADGLKALLSPKTQALPDIDEQISKCFELFSGEVLSFDDYVSGYEGSTFKHGKTTLLERSWSINDIVTNKGETYEIDVDAWMICEDDASREGIAKITVTRNSDEEALIIGYGWPQLYNEGRDLSVMVVNAFDGRDIEALQSLLCAKTLENKTIEAQLQAAVSFFEGKATKGKIGTRNGRDLYDGDHDYSISVSDYEVIENHEPIHTSLSVFIENIETDAGRIYTIEYYTFLLDADDDLEGISQIIITDDKGVSYTIGEKIEPAG